MNFTIIPPEGLLGITVVIILVGAQKIRDYLCVKLNLDRLKGLIVQVIMILLVVTLFISWVIQRKNAIQAARSHGHATSATK